MKSFNGLFEAMTDHEEIKRAIREAADHKKRRPEVKRALREIDEKAEEIRKKLLSGKWHPPKHSKSRLCEGSHKKTRMIEKPRWDDEQIVHHVLMRQFRKIVLPRFYRYSCGSIPGRGPHYAVKTMKRWRDGYQGERFYVAELDIKSFYDSVDVTILKAMLRKTIRDKRYLDVLFRVIDTGAPGLPKGFYTSPWLANFLLTPLDNHITQNLRPDHYLRYMDNMFLFARSKKKLHRMVREISEYLGVNLHLRLKEDWQVFRFEGESRKAKKEPPQITSATGKKKKPKRPPGRAINCLGFVIHNNRITMRKSILKRARAKANRMHRKRRCTRKDASAIISYMGWFSHTDTYKYYLKWIKPKVSVQYCKRRISAISKKQAKGAKKNDRLARSAGQSDGGSRRARHDLELDHRL